MRCAVYTRKSTEEGLEQEYNSLDAQRDAGEAYIQSQQHEGWRCLPDRYDDGGFTGANMDRPALRRLISDIEAGRVDCVVVYKVDRLSRSLLDFAKIMETFDGRGVAFVSVTQAFNTGSSMGRLILNVLLSFAQFEREMISERTRDKIAAARRKGKWAGGMPVLGYQVENTKLVVDPAESQQVREIFQLYLEHQSSLAVARILKERGWRNKRWVTSKGTVRGGRPFDKGTVHKVLTNSVYIGKVPYKDECFDGEHEAIIDSAVFEKVQGMLKRNAVAGGRVTRNKHEALLRGLLRCSACDCAMGHTFAKKGPRLYRYYVCQKAQKRGWNQCPAPSIPAGELERFVVDQIKSIGRDPILFRDTLAQVRVQTQESIRRLEAERDSLQRQLSREAEAHQRELERVGGRAGEWLRDLEVAGQGAALNSVTGLQAQAHSAERRLAEIDTELVVLGTNEIDEQDLRAALRQFDQLWDHLLPKERSRVIELLVEQVSYDGKDGKLLITYQPAGFQNLSMQLTPKTDEAA
jgi:site-specific DNA recombinase